jgi:hypothetical protein
MIRAVRAVSAFQPRFLRRLPSPTPAKSAFLFLTSLSLSLNPFLAKPVSAAQNPTTFKGEITDEHLNCIQTPMKATPGINDKLSCVLYWAHFVQPPSKYVLYDAATKTAYQLSDQNLAQPYAAEKVVVTGKLDPATKTIQVTEIQIAEEASKKS